MPTDLVWAAVTANFRLNSYLWKTPLQWDAARRRFLFLPGAPRAFFWWYFVIFVVYLGIGVGSIGYVFHGQMYHPKPHVKLVFLLQYAMVAVASVMATGISLLIGFCGKDIVSLTNRVIQLYEDLLAAEGKVQKKSRKVFGTRIPSLRDYDGGWDKTGLAFMPLGISLPILAFFLAPLGVIVAKADVFQFVFEDFLSPDVIFHPVINIILLILRTGVVFMLYAENLRIFPFLIFLIGIPAQLVTRIVDSLLKLRLGYGTSQRKWNETLNYFTTLRLITTGVEYPLANQVFVLMGFGLVLSSSLNFTAIRFLDAEMNPGYYAMFPFLSGVVAFVIFAILPVAIGIHENSKKSLFLWRREAGNGDAGLKKRLRAMRPLRFYGGLSGYYFYSIKKSVMSMYMISILDATINLLMSIPDLDFVSMR